MCVHVHVYVHVCVRVFGGGGRGGGGSRRGYRNLTNSGKIDFHTVNLATVWTVLIPEMAVVT